MKQLHKCSKSTISLLGLLICVTFYVPKAQCQTWSEIAPGGTNDWVYASTVYNGDLIVGGKFTAAGSVSANHIARWDGTSWHALGLGVNAKVWALIVHNGLLYVGGEFTEAGGIPMNFIAIWDGTQWSNDLGDMSDIVTSFAIYNNKLIVGGYFTDADGLPVNNIVQHGSGGWTALGTGVVGTQGTVMALEVYNNELIAGGFFTSAGGITASHIAKWNGTTWSALGSGTSNIVYSLTNYNGSLVAGGLFSSAGGLSANNIASWNGSSWSALGTGMSGILYQYVFALKAYNGKLVAGGYFTHSNGIQTNGIASWDGSSWTTMGSGLFMPGNVCGAHTLCVYGVDLIVGGIFNTAGSAFNSYNIAKWNTSPLLIKLSDITARNQGDQNLVSWNTASEAAGDRFLLERSGNGESFIPLSELAARGVAAHYDYKDGKPLEGMNYYRLKLISAGNAVTYSITVSAYALSSSFNVEVYPNPASDIITICTVGEAGNDPSIVITAPSGRVIYASGIKTVSTINVGELEPGLYLVHYTDSNHKRTITLLKK